ncbi:ectonucleoside triphosphate diphosphohydrolase 5 [Sarcoptes scabiei]|nr:ectonucleoside triphosphate diphosphohydrolase 5 [Sarcoptes scabiei]
MFDSKFLLIHTMIAMRFVLFISIVPVIRTDQQSIDDICPSYDILYPCFCSFMPSSYPNGSQCIEDDCLLTVVTCFGKKIENLKSILDRIGDYRTERSTNGMKKFEWFYLIDSETKFLESNLFEKITFKNIYLQNCPKLLFLHEHTFGENGRLWIRNIYINATSLSDVKNFRRKTFKALASLRNIELLEIQSSNLHRIPLRAFNRFTRMKIFRFYSPEIRQNLKQINTRAFFRATELEEIDLKNNQIEKISSFAFQFQNHSKHRLKIFLSGNRLRSDSFQSNAFLGGNGRSITLFLGDYDNCNIHLKTLRREIFEPFLMENTGNIIDMYGCPLICDDQMEWLTNDFDSNRFRYQLRNLVCYNQTNWIHTDRNDYFHINPY